MSVKVTAVKGFVDLDLEVSVIDLSDPVEVRQLHVDVIDDLGFCRRLGEQNRGPAAEGFGVEFVRGDQRHYVLEHRLLAPVIRNRCSHIV